jgi:hypothetical protein
MIDEEPPVRQRTLQGSPFRKAEVSCESHESIRLVLLNLAGLEPLRTPAE